MPARQQKPVLGKEQTSSLAMKHEYTHSAEAEISSTPELWNSWRRRLEKMSKKIPFRGDSDTKVENTRPGEERRPEGHGWLSGELLGLPLLA